MRYSHKCKELAFYSLEIMQKYVKSRYKSRAEINKRMYDWRNKL